MATALRTRADTLLTPCACVFLHSWHVCEGVLLRRLQGDAMLSGVSTVIIDEIHERSLDSDFLLIIIRDLLPKCVPLVPCQPPCACICFALRDCSSAARARSHYQAARPPCRAHVRHAERRDVRFILWRVPYCAHSRCAEDLRGLCSHRTSHLVASHLLGFLVSRAHA